MNFKDNRIQELGLGGVTPSNEQLLVLTDIVEMIDHAHKHTQLTNQNTQLQNFYRGQVSSLLATSFYAPNVGQFDLVETPYKIDTYELDVISKPQRFGIYHKLSEPRTDKFSNTQVLSYDAVVALFYRTQRGDLALRVGKRASQANATTSTTPNGVNIGWKIPTYSIQLPIKSLNDFNEHAEFSPDITNIISQSLLPPDEVILRDVLLAKKLLASFQNQQFDQLFQPKIKLKKLGLKVLNIFV